MSSNSDFAPLIKAGKIESVKRARKLENSISQGRKIFRLLLWLNEINECYELFNNTKMTTMLKALKLTSTFCSFIYYVADNIVFFANIGFLPHEIGGIKFKRIKNTFSFFKTKKPKQLKII